MTSRIQYNNYTILLLYMSLPYGNWYTPTIYMFEGVFQYTSLFTVYDSPLIRVSAPPSTVGLLIMVALYVKKCLQLQQWQN